jgi:hypothetical protein
MKPPPDPHYRHRIPTEIISHAVRFYHGPNLAIDPMATGGIARTSGPPSVYPCTSTPEVESG